MAILNRYANIPTFEDARGDTYSSRYKRLPKSTAYFILKLDKPTTLDALSVKQYGTPVLFWLIADLNDFIDPTILLPAGSVVKIPQI